ncbi:MAG: hypothetical protein NC548_25960 [Lachnospiraceae bacterium]|nr:hypothetical protein [Lachnospiraceae bacterium]
MNVKKFKDFVEESLVHKSLDETKEFYRKRLINTNNPDEQVISKYFNLNHNTFKPMLVEKITINRIISKHGDNGLICISANLSMNDKETNEQNTKNLLKDLMDSPYRFLPVYGGYRDDEMGEYGDFEPSFLVFNYDREGNSQDFKVLKEFGIELCGKYNQSSVLVKSPNEPPVWLNRNGDKISDKETMTVYKNDPKQEFFTSLKNLEDVEKEVWNQYMRYCKDNGVAPTKDDRFKKFKKKHLTDIHVSKRFTYDMQFGSSNLNEYYYVNPSPWDRNEEIMRHNCGEILVFKQIFD